MINKYKTGVVNDIENFVAENQKPRGWQFLDDYINDKEKTINILDIGCGSGNTILHLWQSGYKNIQGIEYTKELYEQMLTTHPYLKIQTGNAENLFPLENGMYDCVYCNQVLEHLPHPELAVKEAYRVLKGGGVYIISVPNGHHLNDVITKIIQKIIYRRYEHLQSFNHKSIKCMLENQGFVVNKSMFRKHSLDFLLDDRIPQPFRVIATGIIYPICKKLYWKDMFFDILATK